MHSPLPHISFKFIPSCDSPLFADVINCMQTDNLELKKLVYLYLMNYAKSHPDLAIMAVNTFVKVRSSILAFPFSACNLGRLDHKSSRAVVGNSAFLICTTGL
jgi:hypothetical protein